MYRIFHTAGYQNVQNMQCSSCVTYSNVVLAFPSQASYWMIFKIFPPQNSMCTPYFSSLMPSPSYYVSIAVVTMKFVELYVKLSLLSIFLVSYIYPITLFSKASNFISLRSNRPSYFLTCVYFSG